MRPSDPPKAPELAADPILDHVFVERRSLGESRFSSRIATPKIKKNIREGAEGELFVGSIKDIKHVVILMQENRSFDEYFGTFPGATGFGDPNGNFANQYGPDQYGNDIKPFRMSTFTSTGLERDGCSHDWSTFHKLYNNGQSGQQLWQESPPPNQAPKSIMGYYAANDIPFHWALGSTFALCDQYYGSVLGPTFPNRLFFMTGTLGNTAAPGAQGPQIGDPGGYPSSLDLPWQTYPDMLNAVLPPLASPPYTWTVYVEDMDGQGNEVGWPTAPSAYNGGSSPWTLNVLQQFEAWAPLLNPPLGQAVPGSPQVPTQVGQFKNDIAAHRLASISWIIPPFGATEWENNHPSDGAVYIAETLDAILQGTDENGNPYWDSTVFIIVYDEAGGHFDHVIPPVAPATESDEYVDGQPIGAGFRVPAIIISPWTVNRGVQHDPYDHTSVLQFLEQVTKNLVPGGVRCTNLSNWRRTFGDLTPVFDFNSFVSASEAMNLFPWRYQNVPGSQNYNPQYFDTSAYAALAYARFIENSGRSLAPPALVKYWPPVAQSIELIMPDGSYDLGQANALAVTAPGGTVSATFPAALQVRVIGFEPNELYNQKAMAAPVAGVSVISSGSSSSSGACTTRVPVVTFSNPNITAPLSSVSIDQDPSQAMYSGPEYQQPVPYSTPTLSGFPLIFTFTYDVVINNYSEVFPPAPTDMSDPVKPTKYAVNAVFQVDATFTSVGELEVTSTADPQFYKNFFNDTSWLSGELVVFSLAAGGIKFNQTLGSQSNPATATSTDALNFINAVIESLNGPNGPVGDFDGLDEPEANNPLPLATTAPGAIPVFNFALARVHMNSTQAASDVRVFFRSCRASVTTGAYDAQTSLAAPAFYRSNPPTGPAPGSGNDTKVPLLGVKDVTPAGGGASTLEYVTIPFFATPRINAGDPSKSMQDQPPDSPLLTGTGTGQGNVRNMAAASGGAPSVAYFGCWLDINQPTLLIPATPPSNPAQWDGPFQQNPAKPNPALSISAAFLRDLHQCLVAEISFDPIIIPPSDVPGSSAWLAQRNLALVTP
jgi:phospholipase C